MKSNFFTENLLKNDLVAAPLAGISHIPFRQVLRKFFDGIVYSEMMSVEGISRQNPESMEYLERLGNEYPLVFQLFGGKPESFSEAVKIAEDKVVVDAFDVNMGCPVKKVIKTGGGCGLLSDLPRIKEIVKNIRKSTTKPFSIKIRIGLTADKLVYRDIINIAESEGADAVIIHARTKSDMFGGTVRLDCLREAVSLSSIPIIGNGGVVNYETYKEMKETGVAGVMIGRGMMKAPWIFQAIREKKDFETYLNPIQINSLLQFMWQCMVEHARGRENKQTHYMHIFRKQAVWFSKGLHNGAEFRTKIYQTQKETEVLDLTEKFFTTVTI